MWDSFLSCVADVDTVGCFGIDDIKFTLNLNNDKCTVSVHGLGLNSGCET